MFVSLFVLWNNMWTIPLRGWWVFLWAPSVSVQFSVWGLRVSGNTTCSPSMTCPLHTSFTLIKHWLSKWGSGTLRGDPTGERGKQIHLLSSQSSLPLAPLLFWITCIIVDITFLYWLPVPTHNPPPVEFADVIKWMWLFLHVRKKQKKKTRLTLKSCLRTAAGSDWGFNLYLISFDFIFIHTHHFLTPSSYMFDPGVTDAVMV